MVNSLRLLHLRSRIRELWSAYQSPQGLVFKRRDYARYEDYVKHQQTKLNMRSRSKNWKHDAKYRSVLRERLEEVSVSFSGKKVLCLGARTGGEVQSFLDLGAFAVGIDLNPGKENRYVLFGDFHDVQFPENSVDIVFTNALDHVLYMDKWIAEVQRVLVPQGLLIFEAIDGRDKRSSVGFYESFWWNAVDDLAALFERSQFKLSRRSRIDFPYRGEQLVLIKETSIPLSL